MVGVAMGNENAVYFLGLGCRGAAKACRQITSEQLIVAAIHKNNLAVR